MTNALHESACHWQQCQAKGVLARVMNAGLTSVWSVAATVAAAAAVPACAPASACDCGAGGGTLSG